MAAPTSIHQAKTHLSKLIARAEAGEEIILSRGKKPVAKIVGLEPKKRVRSLEGSLPPISLDQGFWDPLPDDELRLWNGEGDD